MRSVDYALGSWVGVLALTVPVVGQSLNFSFSDNLLIAPATNYTAAGLPGQWNATPAVHATTYQGFRKLDGTSASGVSMLNIGGLALQAADNPQTSGNDEALLDKYLVTFNPLLESCLFFNGLENGTYQVITYAWLPNAPAVDSYVTVDFANEGGELVGGVWRGEHERGVTYSVHMVEVTTGALAMHSGIPPAETGSAALNGLQLRKLSTTHPMDADGDDDLDQADLHAFTGCMTGPTNKGPGPVCGGFDHDNSDTIDLADYAEVQRAFASP